MPAEADLSAKTKSTNIAAVRDTARQFLTAFRTPGLILVAVSGGSDSKGLLLALHEAVCRTSGFSLAACTVDHALRCSSAAEAQAVARLCARLGIVHVTRRWDGFKPATGLQAAARHARYTLLADVARRMGALCIVTGHSRNDQIETIAMRSARADKEGAGLAGMADAVLFARDTWVLRPFLSLDRAAIRSDLSARGETWFDDPSNDSDRFERVRVRRMLAENGEPAPAHAAKPSQREVSTAHAAEFLARHATICEGLVARIAPVPVGVARSPPAALGILSLAACLGGRRYRPGRETTQRVIRFIDSHEDGRLTAGRVVFDRRRSGLYLYREARDLPDLVLAAGEAGLWDGRFLVRNASDTAVGVSAAGAVPPVVARLIAAGVPQSVARRAAKAAPAILFPETAAQAEAPVNAALCLSPWDTFLPRFDLTLANQCAVLFGRAPYKRPPVYDVCAEKTGF